ncbi:MAG: hypothetical protein J6Y52_03565 [Bacteroidales bacterium]|nr:hypothetical protein [Bacteroidales bacterium]
MKHIFSIAAIVLALLTASCGASRYVSADSDLEELYVGKTYYEIVDDFGRPDATIDDGREGTKVAYNAVSLNGTRAAGLYKQFKMRNRASGNTGAPVGGITFSFNSDMKCYAVDSDFQHERVKAGKQPKAEKPRDRRLPDKIKPIIPRSVDFPLVKSRTPNAEMISIEKVKVEKDQITVYFQYRNRTPVHRSVNDDGLYIMPEVYVEDAATGVRSALRKVEGITLYPKRTYFSKNVGGYDILLYSLTFDPVAEECEYINVVEPGHSGYNFYGIDIRTPMSSKDELKNLN